MERTVYASSEERMVKLLYERLGTLQLLRDKKGNPLKWKKVYPPLEKLIAHCKKKEMDLPISPKLNDVLVAMVRAGYHNIHPSIVIFPGSAIENLSDRVFDKAMKEIPLASPADPPPAEPPPADHPPADQSKAPSKAQRKSRRRKKPKKNKINAKQDKKATERAKADIAMDKEAARQAEKDAEIADWEAKQKAPPGKK